MELFVNDLSIHLQFHDYRSFSGAFDQLVVMRDAAKKFSHEVYINRAILERPPIRGVSMQQAIRRSFEENKQRAILNWVARGCWDDGAVRKHQGDDYLTCQSDIVTDSAVGEAAFRVFHGKECGLVSIIPSDWDYSPVEVGWHQDSEEPEVRRTTLENWRSASALEERLRDITPAICSWNQLEKASPDRFVHLKFANNCFEYLEGVPFAKCTSERILELLDMLDRLTSSFDTKGERTREGDRIYQEHFTGKKAWFSDSSDDEKNRFQQKLTFPHPDNPGEKLFCPWHGKENHMTFRLHFSGPAKFGHPVYVVYVGPKRTKR